MNGKDELKTDENKTNENSMTDLPTTDEQSETTKGGGRAAIGLIVGGAAGAGSLA